MKILANQTTHGFSFLLRAKDRHQNMMKDNAPKPCLRQMPLLQEKKAKKFRTIVQRNSSSKNLYQIQIHQKTINK